MEIANLIAVEKFLILLDLLELLMANLILREILLHFAEISGDNKVEIIHPASYVRAGFANEIVKESTNLHIISNCLIATKSREFIVCQKAEDKYEVIRNNPDSDSTLKMIVTSGKEFQLIKQSWIDSIRFEI
ncbi:hypothetical protein PVAND_016055 [Polypedilum vanderplanki]|uniref:Uncharacterized protein n=1 Tax=Polypedilum vanderplanki TaxID=319348 RepID=A0A9J6BEC0_POLVA|nr:hypothetical protein PVAND_016055 [Polypedilum vanderplanki]